MCEICLQWGSKSFNFLWKIPIDASESEILDHSIKWWDSLKESCPVFHSRAMRSEFISLFGKLTSINQSFSETYIVDWQGISLVVLMQKKRLLTIDLNDRVWRSWSTRLFQVVELGQCIIGIYMVLLKLSCLYHEFQLQSTFLSSGKSYICSSGPKLQAKPLHWWNSNIFWTWYSNFLLILIAAAKWVTTSFPVNSLIMTTIINCCLCFGIYILLTLLRKINELFWFPSFSVQSIQSNATFVSMDDNIHQNWWTWLPSGWSWARKASTSDS